MIRTATPNPTGLALILALLGAVTLAACGPQDVRTPGQQLDGAISEAKQASREARTEAQRALDRTETSVKDAAAATADAVSDATITAKIKTALAVDDRLKATRIEVDSVNGMVTLTGTAPDATSLSRATMLAEAVKGVRAVDNRLVVAQHG